MNPIIDTALLKHHRVDYSNRIDTDGAKRPTNVGRTFALVMMAMIAAVAMSLATNSTV